MKLDFKKYLDQLVPVVVQDSETAVVLMLGFMNEDAFRATQASGRVTFFSRTRSKLWVKGESSGNFLYVVELDVDCDSDTLLIKARPSGPVCHLGTDTCFGERNTAKNASDSIAELENIIDERRDLETETSYVAGLFKDGINRIARKVGEEAVELVIEAKDDDPTRFKEEAADLLFHFLVLLRAKDVSFNDVVQVLEARRG